LRNEHFLQKQSLPPRSYLKLSEFFLEHFASATDVPCERKQEMSSNVSSFRRETRVEFLIEKQSRADFRPTVDSR